MRFLFLDESGKIEDGRLFALGGIAVRDTDWAPLRDLWQGTLREAGWPLDREVKWHGIRTGEVPPKLADAVFDTLARAPITAYVCLLDCEAGPRLAPRFFATPEETYQTALMFLAERFHHLLTAEDDHGQIVVDSRFREDDHRLRRFFAGLAEDGDSTSASRTRGPSRRHRARRRPASALNVESSSSRPSQGGVYCPHAALACRC